MLNSMPSVKVSCQSKHPLEDAYVRVKKFLENDKDLHKLDPGYKCHFDDQSFSGTAQGKQFKASLKVTEKSSDTLVEITVDLPFHLALAKGMIEKTLQKKLDHALKS